MAGRIFWHLLGILAVFHGVYYREFIFPTVRSFCYGEIDLLNSTINGKVEDYLKLPVEFIKYDVGVIMSIVCVVIVLLYVAYVLRTMHQAFFGQPVQVYHQLDRDVGYLLTPGRTKRDIANMVRRRKKIGDIPPPYPNGWYEIMRSKDLPVGAAKAVSLVGEHFAVFRRENGHVSVMDAYCPHLGANLGVGGQVRGNCIECPFHGWQFDGDTGQCTAIPYAAKVPSFAKTKVWPSLEVNGYIFVWYDAEGREPHFYPEEIKEIKNGSWFYKGSTVHYVNCHIEVICIALYPRNNCF